MSANQLQGSAPFPKKSHPGDLKGGFVFAGKGRTSENTPDSYGAPLAPPLTAEAIAINNMCMYVKQ